MSSELPTGSGLANGRQWSALPVDGAPIEWSIDMDKGCVQGPLDLEFMRGQKLSLVLAEDQQALLVHEGQLKTVYLDGVHYLEIGQGARQINPSCQLIFLALAEPLQLHWPRASALQWGPAAHQTLIGNCTLRIEWPSRFFTTFLQGHPNPDPDFITRLIDQMVRGLFTDHLSAGLDGATGPSAIEIQARLTRLMPDDLNEDLNACGLRCTHLAVYTSAPPVEDELSRTVTNDQNVSN